MRSIYPKIIKLKKLKIEKMITFIVGLFCMPVAVLMGTILSYKPSNINEAAARSGYKHGRRAAWNFQV